MNLNEFKYNMADENSFTEILLKIMQILETLNKFPNYEDFFYSNEMKEFFNNKFFGSCIKCLLGKNRYDDN